MSQSAVHRVYLHMARLGVAATVLGALALAAGCSGSGYRYVSNGDEDLHFKVPDDWAVYDTEEILAPLFEDRARVEFDAVLSQRWVRGFDGADQPSPTNVLSGPTDDPRGYAEVRVLSPDERDTFSLMSLRRSALAPVDPVSGAPVDPLDAAQYEVLRYDDDLVVGDGIRGNRLTLRVADEVPWVLDQIALVDAGTTKRYLFTIGCSVTCWDANQSLLLEIADSYTLEDR